MWRRRAAITPRDCRIQARARRRPVGPTPRLSPPRGGRQAQELLAISAELNDVTKVVVEYWADPTGSQTPPGHWTRICEYVSVRDNHTLDDVRAHQTPQVAEPPRVLAHA